jgi:hypothetical protein
VIPESLWSGSTGAVGIAGGSWLKYTCTKLRGAPVIDMRVGDGGGDVRFQVVGHQSWMCGALG